MAASGCFLLMFNLTNWRHNIYFERLLFSFFPCPPERVVTYLAFYESWSYCLKKHEAVFLKRQNLIFPIAAGSIWFVFCFRLNIFTSKISNLMLPFWAKGGVNLYIPKWEFPTRKNKNEIKLQVIKMYY